jgi:HPt (histidine-containing phosphotransfer) domain-containing protein
MFLEKGFNDFLGKPIDISKMDEILYRWIPKRKRKPGMMNEESAIVNQELGKGLSPVHGSKQLIPTIPGVDIKQGIAMTNGKASVFRQVLSAFRNDAEKLLPLLQAAPDPDALHRFVSEIHNLKNASASIGAAEVSALASQLEEAGKSGDLEFIGKQLPDFAGKLNELIDGIKIWESAAVKLPPS